MGRGSVAAAGKQEEQMRACRAGWYGICALGVLLSGSVMAAGAAQETASRRSLVYRDFIKQLFDLDRLIRPTSGVQAGLASSWDRNGRNVWGANGDAGHYERIEPNGEAVMMDVDGPGCIYRIWSANPQGTIRVYLDGADKPTYEWDFNKLFHGEIAPFIKPFVWQREDRKASDCYLPIPFARHIKITADTNRRQYYQFNYLTFPKDWSVESFRTNLTGAEQGSLAEAANVWGRPGQDPKPPMPNQQTERKQVEIPPGQTVTIADIDGPAIVRAIKLYPASQQRYVWRKVVLTGTWDGSDWPQVHTPIGPFFGFDWNTAEYASVPSGCKDGTAYSYWPMPFRKRGKLELTNHQLTSVRVDVEVSWAPAPELPPDMLYFFARWRSEPNSVTFDYPFLETAGRGHFVGVAMPIDHPLAGWWGEGDEKVWVDDDDWPRFVGTGSEDYFGDAWGILYLNGPSWGCSSFTGIRTCNYRWHFMDLIPFEKRMRMTIENYGPNGAGPRGQYEYTSTAFWYQAELAPPFEQLQGVVFTGGADPKGKPEPQTYANRIFQKIGSDALRTYGRSEANVFEAEDLLRLSVRNGVGHIVTDAAEPYELSRERGVDFGEVQPGATLADFTVPNRTAGVYTPEILIAPLKDSAQINLVINGTRLEVDRLVNPGTVRLHPAPIGSGPFSATFMAATGGHAIIDGIRLTPAPRARAAMEAEEVTIVGSRGGSSAPTPGPAAVQFSAARALEWNGVNVGASVTVRFPDPQVPSCTLGVVAETGPDAPTIQAYIKDQPAGPPLDLYQPQKGVMPVPAPLTTVQQGSTVVEIRVVGTNPASSSHRLALDYFRYEPQILSADSAEGVRAFVLGTHASAYEIQSLGPAYSAGHHLWIQPSSRNAYVDLVVEVGQAGEYDFGVRLTRSWDYAIVQVSLDGQSIGAPINAYAAEVTRGEITSLSKHKLEAGRHILRLQAVDKDEGSAGYLMGLDDLVITRVGP